MSTTSVSVPQPDPKGTAGPGLLDLNALLRQSLKKHEALLKEQNVVIRCESLPEVQGDPERMTQLLDHIFAMILPYRANGSKLFLYVDCQEAESSPATGIDGKSYQILFHTNISSDAAWKEENRQRLSQCAEMLSNFGGELTVNTIQSTGCLFVISLPGKMNDTCHR